MTPDVDAARPDSMALSTSEMVKTCDLRIARTRVRCENPSVVDDHWRRVSGIPMTSSLRRLPTARGCSRPHAAATRHSSPRSNRCWLLTNRGRHPLMSRPDGVCNPAKSSAIGSSSSQPWAREAWARYGRRRIAN